MLNIFQQTAHPMLPQATHEERSRQEFAKGLRGYIQAEMLPGLAPLFRKLCDSQPEVAENRHAVRRAMVDEPYFQGYAAANRVAQELLWLAVIDSIENDMPRLEQEAARIDGSTGSLSIDPDLEMPRYITALDIHCMPGGYTAQADTLGIGPGALYDRGVYLYSMGYGGPFTDDKGRSVCNYVRRNLTGFEPKRILDMGCSVGQSTLPYKEIFPDAELWAIDIAAPMVRYAYLRAAGMGYDINFAQMNAERTSFPDAHFDLIVSHILLHETSGKAMPRVFEECFRLLEPGGWMIHSDLPPFDLMDPLTQFILDNETYYNNEPFWGAMREADQVELARKAGFEVETIKFDTAPMAIRESAAKAKGYDAKAAEAVASRKFKAGEFAPGGGWEVLIARKPGAAN